MMTPAQNYYKKFILGYQVEDLRSLLDRKERRSAILLAPVFSGIDAIGGTLEGFGSGNSKARSVAFCHRWMSFREGEAQFLYESLRCGFLHQGTAKYGVKFFAIYGMFNRTSTFYKEGDWVWLDVVKLAEQFVETAEHLWETSRDSILHYPPKQVGNQEDLLHDLPHIDQLKHDVMKAGLARRSEVVDGKIERFDYTSMPAYSPDSDMTPTFEIPSNSSIVDED